MTGSEYFGRCKFKYTLTNTMGFDAYWKLSDEMMDWVRLEADLTGNIYFRVNDCTYFGFNDPHEASLFKLKYGNYIKT